MGRSVEGSKTSDALDKLIESIGIINYSYSMMASPKDLRMINELERGKSSLIVLLQEDLKPEVNYPSEDVYVIKIPPPKTGFWMSLNPANVKDPLDKLRSLMTADLKAVFVLNPNTTELLYLTYLALKTLRAVNTSSKFIVFLDVETDNKDLPYRVNFLSFVSEVLTSSPNNFIVLMPFKRIAKYFSDNDIIELQSKCFREVVRLVTSLKGASKLRASSALQLTCFKSKTADVFKNLASLVKFARFVNWGDYFKGREGYIYIEGPKKLIDENELQLLSRSEGWSRYEAFTKEDANKISLVLIEYSPTVLGNLLGECMHVMTREKSLYLYKNLQSYVAIYRSLRRLENYLS